MASHILPGGSRAHQVKLTAILDLMREYGGLPAEVVGPATTGRQPIAGPSKWCGNANPCRWVAPDGAICVVVGEHIAAGPAEWVHLCV
jgi:hypothetical protein